MKNILWTAAATGLLALCMCGCGGSSDDPVTQACNKLQSCGTISTVMSGVTTAADCVTEGNAMLNQPGAPKAQIEQGITSCLTYTDCTTFTSCIKALQSSSP